MNTLRNTIIAVSTIMLSACTSNPMFTAKPTEPHTAPNHQQMNNEPVDTEPNNTVTEPKVDKSKEPELEMATFAGGCFWCSEADFEKLTGVQSVISGFAGGTEENPAYEAVAGGYTGHREAVQVTYDANMVSYDILLDAYWRHVNPTDDGGQFVDRGKQYSTAIFYHSEQQKTQAEASKKALDESGRYDAPIVTPILEYTTFYRAEEYHQDYFKKNPLKYRFYRHGSGRDQHIEQVWGKDAKVIQKEDTKPMPTADSTGFDADSFEKPIDDELKQSLSPLSYKVTQQEGTERAFENEYWDNKEEGIYVDIVSGEPLFSSTHKYVSGTGWPSFWQPLDAKNITEHTDRKLFITRTEVRSKHADSHLGHVFDDGPDPTGKRYCMNSAAMRFVPKAKLAEEGYGEYAPLFE